MLRLAAVASATAIVVLRQVAKWCSEGSGEWLSQRVIFLFFALAERCWFYSHGFGMAYVFSFKAS